jgi:hypothetical protein
MGKLVFESSNRGELLSFSCRPSTSTPDGLVHRRAKGRKCPTNEVEARVEEAEEKCLGREEETFPHSFPPPAAAVVGITPALATSASAAFPPAETNNSGNSSYKALCYLS